MNVCGIFVIIFIVDYDFDFYGYSDYRGGYTEPSFYEDYYRSYEGDYFFEYPPAVNSVIPVTVAAGIGGTQRTTRNTNAVGSS